MEPGVAMRIPVHLWDCVLLVNIIQYQRINRSKRINVYVIRYYGHTPKSQAYNTNVSTGKIMFYHTPFNSIWQCLALQVMTEGLRRTWQNRVLPQDIQLNLAMPRLALQVMTEGQHRGRTPKSQTRRRDNKTEQ